MTSERNCEQCKHHSEQGCSSWDCEFEKKMTREEAMYLLNNLRSVAEGKEDEAIDMAIEALSNHITESPNDVVESQDDVITEDYMW